MMPESNAGTRVVLHVSLCMVKGVNSGIGEYRGPEATQPGLL